MSETIFCIILSNGVEGYEKTGVRLLYNQFDHSVYFQMITEIGSIEMEYVFDLSLYDKDTISDMYNDLEEVITKINYGVLDYLNYPKLVKVTSIDVNYHSNSRISKHIKSVCSVGNSGKIEQLNEILLDYFKYCLKDIIEGGYSPIDYKHTLHEELIAKLDAEKARAAKEDLSTIGTHAVDALLRTLEKNVSHYKPIEKIKKTL